MRPLKKKQHYVWKYYLKAWSQNDQIFCKRSNNVFQSALENIGQSRFFYEAVSLNAIELELIKGFYKSAHPTAEQNLTGLLNLYIVSSESDEYSKKCGIEEFHAIVEEKAIDTLSKLYRHDLSFFENDDFRNHFSFFMGCQYTRTKKMRENLMLSPWNVPPNVSKEKLSQVYSLFFADIIGNWIYSKSKIKVLINESTTHSFITADQPVINVKAEDYRSPVQQVELYYPISPKVAILFSEQNSGLQRLTEIEVTNWNSHILRHASEQIYAKNKSDFLY
jgi:hypothetical protein